MKLVLLLAATATMLGAPAAQSQRQVGPDGQLLDQTAEKACHERIELVRAERGLPELERDVASPQEPLLFTALDYKVDGCAALVMRHDTSDIRPLPVIPNDQPLFMPAN